MSEFFDLEAEMAVLKTCLRYPEAPGDAMAMGIRPAHFSESHGVIFSAILAVAETDVPVSQGTVVRQLAAVGKLDAVGGQAYIEDIWRTAETGLPYYGLAVMERARMRREYQLVHRHLQALSAPGADVSAEMARFRELLLRDDDQDIRDDGPRHVGAILEDGAFERLDRWIQNPQEIRGIRTGFEALDRLMGGLAPKRLTVVGASTSAGKTQWMQHLARFAAIGEHPTLLLSTEMSTDDNVFRWAFMEAGFDRLPLERHGIPDASARQLRAAAARLAERPIYAWEMGGVELARVRLAVRRMKVRHGIKLVLLDMMNGLDVAMAKGKNYAQAVGDLMAGLHALAVGEDVHLMVTAHVNRDAMKEQGRVLGLHDFRDSGAVEQWADQALTLQPVDENRRVITREQANEQSLRHGRVLVLANLCKNRFGSLGMVDMALNWDAGGRFTEVA